MPRRPLVVPSTSVLFFALLVVSHLPAQVPSVPIHVTNPTSLVRAGEPVSFGIPLNRVPALTDPTHLTVFDAGGQPVPSQFKVLCRWGADRAVTTAPMKWVLVTFRPTVPPNSTADFTVVSGPVPPAGGMTTTTTASAITVNAGPGLSFTVPTAVCAPFSQATVGGTAVVTTPGAIEMNSPTGSPIPAVVTSPTVLEENGSMRVVLRQKGTLGALQYTARWYFHAGRSDVTFDFRLENSAAYGLFDANVPDGQQYFDSLYVSQPVNGGVQTVTSTIASRALAASALYDLRQSFTWAMNLNLLAGFNYTEAIGTSTLATGGSYGGAIDASGPNGGVTVAVDRFWQSFPKSLRVQAGAIKVGLFPEWGHGPEYRGRFESPASTTTPIDPMALLSYRFEGGRWKSHRMIFDFHGPGGRTPADVSASAARANSPLAGYPEPSVVRTSGATGTLFIEKSRPLPYPSFRRYQQFYDMVGDDQFADITQGVGRIGLPEFLNRGGTWGTQQTYGWENYGDIPWADGYCDLHYDWPASVLLGYLRSGDYKLFERGRDMAAFRRDYAQNHSTNVAEAWRGAAFYEKGWWHGNGAPGVLTHNWIQGVLLHHVITGDEGSREAALENIAFVLRTPPSQWSGYWGSRMQGWPIDCLVDAYNFLGNPQWLTEAGLGVGRFQHFEVADGSHGYHLNPANGVTAIWGDNIFFVAAVKYTAASLDMSYVPMLQRMKTWFKNTCVLHATGTLTALNLPKVYDQWSPASPGLPSIHQCWAMIDALSYSAVLFSDQDDLNVATELFESTVRYWQIPPDVVATYNILDPDSFSRIAMRPLQFPQSESKVLGEILHFGNSHIAARSLFAGVW